MFNFEALLKLHEKTVEYLTLVHLKYNYNFAFIFVVVSHLSFCIVVLTQLGLFSIFPLQPTTGSNCVTHASAKARCIRIPVK